MTDLQGTYGEDTREPMGHTLPQLLHQRAGQYSSRDFLRAKRHGIWERLTWHESLNRVRALALAMIARGISKGDVIAVIGENLPEAYLVQYAALCVGAVTTHLYPDASAAELGYILRNCEASLLFAENQEQVDKFLLFGAAQTEVKGVIYLDDRGLWHYDNPLLVSFKSFVDNAPTDAHSIATLDACIAAGTDQDLAALCYTSGTTGNPKGVRLTHRHLLDNAYRLISSFNIAPHIDYFSYISPAWAAEQYTGVSLSVLAPAVVHFAEKPETVSADMREISPEFLLFTPRQWEMISSSIEVQMLDASPLRQRMYHWAIKASRRQKWLAELLILRAIRDNTGLGRAKFPISAGSGLSEEIFRRFHALGIPLKNLYGSTEAGLVSAHWNEHAEPSTLGIPLQIARSIGQPLQLRIGQDGEMLVRGGAGFGGYYRDDVATANVMDSEGFFHTGDAMHVHPSGELVFLDRVKDMQKLANGNSFPPQTIENHLRASPFLRDAIVLGDETRGFIAALINVDSGIFGRYLETRNIGWGTFAELSQLDAVLERILIEVKHVNALLPPSSRIARLATLPKELDADDAELTRSRKLKRNVIATRYASLIESIYAGEQRCNLVVSVGYQDGSTGTVQAEIRILSTDELTVVNQNARVGMTQ